MKPAGMIVTFLALALVASADEGKTLRSEHVVVAYRGIGEAYPRAIARTVEAARAVASESGFDMPNVINVRISADPKASARLYAVGVYSAPFTGLCPPKAGIDQAFEAWGKRGIPVVLS